MGVLSGFGTPDNPPEYGLKHTPENVIPKSDTHPGTGLRHLENKVEEIEGRDLLGEDGE